MIVLLCSLQKSGNLGHRAVTYRGQAEPEVPGRGSERAPEQASGGPALRTPPQHASETRCPVPAKEGGLEGRAVTSRLRWPRPDGLSLCCLHSQLSPFWGQSQLDIVSRNKQAVC